MSNIQLVENLYRLRKAHHYTQQQMSDLLNISLDQLVNHPCTKDGMVLEQKGPFTPAMEIETADTIYLTREEVDMIKSFRNLSEEDKLLVRKLL